MQIPKPGDVLAKVTGAVGIKPCGGCQKARELMNEGEVLQGLSMIPGNIASMARNKLTLPDGYRLRLQGQRDSATQILLAQNVERWSTFEWANGELSAGHPFVDEAEARADFAVRMKNGL